MYLGYFFPQPCLFLSPEYKVEAGYQLDHLGRRHRRRVDEEVSLARARVPHGQPQDGVLRSQRDQADVLQVPERAVLAREANVSSLGHKIPI